MNIFLIAILISLAGYAAATTYGILWLWKHVARMRVLLGLYSTAMEAEPEELLSFGARGVRMAPYRFNRRVPL
jgi:hypothetical protein